MSKLFTSINAATAFALQTTMAPSTTAESENVQPLSRTFPTPTYSSENVRETISTYMQSDIQSCVAGLSSRSLPSPRCSRCFSMAARPLAERRVSRPYESRLSLGFAVLVAWLLRPTNFLGALNASFEKHQRSAMIWWTTFLGRNVWISLLSSMIGWTTFSNFPFAPKLIAIDIIMIFRQLAFIGTIVSEGLIGKFSHEVETAVEAQIPLAFTGLLTHGTGGATNVYQSLVPAWLMAIGTFMVARMGGRAY